MDTFQRLILFFIAFSFAVPSYANFPASIVAKSYCYSSSGSSYSCSGPKFDGPQAAMNYACQQNYGQQSGMVNSATMPLAAGTTMTPASSGQGLSSWGTFGWNFSCTSSSGAEVSGGQYRVQALADCKGSTPINNYSPATCAGSEPIPPPVACTNTGGIVISAYHPTPAILVGCYAGCTYNATNVVITEYNGVQYESGSWTGVAAACPADTPGLIGGAPGNSQYVGSGGGLVPSDLANLATEQTLQQVLQTLQAGDLQSGVVAAENKALLQQIAQSTAETAAGGSSPTTVPDPDGFEAEYESKLAANQVDADGKLPASAIPNTTVDVSNTFSNVSGFIGNRSCPVPPSFSVKGHTYQFDMTLICGLAEGLSYLVVVLASISGVRIFTGGM